MLCIDIYHSHLWHVQMVRKDSHGSTSPGNAVTVQMEGRLSIQGSQALQLFWKRVTRTERAWNINSVSTKEWCDNDTACAGTVGMTLDGQEEGAISPSASSQEGPQQQNLTSVNYGKSEEFQQLLPCFKCHKRSFQNCAKTGSFFQENLKTRNIVES